MFQRITVMIDECYSFQMAENKTLSENNNTTSNNIVTSDLSVKVEEEEVDMFAPFTPDSLSTPGSDFEEDSDSSGFASGGFESRSPVDSRFRVPAEATQVLQQKEQNRDAAAGRGRPSASSKSPEPRSTSASVHQLLALFVWLHLLGPLHLERQLLGLDSESSRPDCLTMKLPIESTLPPKKRNHWWGSHRPSPHPKT